MESHLFLVLWIPVFETKQIQRFFKSIFNNFFLLMNKNGIHAKKGQFYSYSYTTKLIGENLCTGTRPRMFQSSMNRKMFLYINITTFHYNFPRN